MVKPELEKTRSNPDTPSAVDFGNPVLSDADSFCCGCICVSKCIWNSAKGWEEVVNIMRTGKFTLKKDLKTMIELDELITEKMEKK